MHTRKQMTVKTTCAIELSNIITLFWFVHKGTFNTCITERMDNFMNNKRMLI